MHRTVHAHLRLPQETVRRLDRLRRGSHQPLARFITTILADYVDDGRAARPPRRSHPPRRRAA
jgi:predicted DNA-binding protein